VRYVREVVVPVVRFREQLLLRKLEEFPECKTPRRAAVVGSISTIQQPTEVHGYPKEMADGEVKVDKFAWTDADPMQVNNHTTSPCYERSGR
jgi:hypothetical protein